MSTLFPTVFPQSSATIHCQTVKILLKFIYLFILQCFLFIYFLKEATTILSLPSHFLFMPISLYVFFSLSHRICTFVKSKQDKLGQILMKMVSSSHSSVWKHIDHVMGSRSLANIVEKVQAAGLLGRPQPFSIF